MNRAATTTGRRPSRRPGELYALELPLAGDRVRPARSPAAWLAALERDPRPRTAAERRLAEHYAGRAVRRGERWVVMLGDHKPRRAFRWLRDVELADLACAPSAALLTRPEAEALVEAGVTRADVQPLYDPSPDCSALGTVRLREALERLVELGHAAVRFHDGAVSTPAGYLASGVIAIPNPWE